MRIFAIDPGTTQSGVCLYDTQKRTFDQVEILDNYQVLDAIVHEEFDELAIEMIASYGMAVGRETFETCVWIGRFVQLYCGVDNNWIPVYRKDVKSFLCGDMKANDSNIRQAVIDLFGGKDKAIGKKSNPGTLYGVKSHIWSSVAVALTAESKIKTIGLNENCLQSKGSVRSQD